MAKRVFFSFHYQDVIDFRANVVRNHWMTKPDRDEAGFFDSSIWETARRQGEDSLKRLINGGLENTTNTSVLVGAETYLRPWVRYEILKSFRRSNHLFGVHINGIKSKASTTKPLGQNPFEHVGVTYSNNGETGTLWQKVDGKWVEYDRIGGSSHFSCNVPAQFRGEGFNLARWYKLYDWVSDDGYNNFASWVK